MLNVLLVRARITNPRYRVLKPSEFNEYLGSTKDFSGFKIEGLTPETMGTTKQELLEGALELIRKKL
ncbi:hypothetical protein KHA90_18525 [Flavobacterium psychroterrae]|uniref:Uncharacterized protein n=1 Tax=Flavobacterium psychroterrae TaxID=2133767 RepID=A0ABS5PFH9_9FLAO|nr:hypothetical protein [Flavobacterium psychroterrae]MBS7233021.1 hypothetical protein [Flavobacterium psychroterrae]